MRELLIYLGLVMVPSAAYCQNNPPPPAQQQANRAAITPATPAPAASGSSKRIFWIIPNYRTYPTMANYKPLTVREKFKIATQDSTDPGTFVLAAAFAGLGQLQNSNPSFGQGMEGYGHRFITSYADLAIGDYMTTAIYPSLLHQDPRYFRRGTGSFKSRLGYAVKQLFWTHNDSGARAFNYSEVAGNATAAAIANAYYPDNRTAGDTAVRFGMQMGLDAAGNILKEFWPDLHDRFAKRHQP